MALFIRNAPSLVCMVLLFITILSLCEFSSGGGYSYCRIRSRHKIPKRPMFGRQIGKGTRNDHYIEFVKFIKLSNLKLFVKYNETKSWTLKIISILSIRHKYR